MTTHEIADKLASVNACLNATSALLLFGGRWAIARKQPLLHRNLMVGAFCTSAIFLVSYLTRVYLSGTHPYPGHGIGKVIYLCVLISHMILAVIVVPLILRALFLAWKKRFPEHVRIVRYTFPIWAYVSVTGVVVYVMLYHLAG